MPMQLFALGSIFVLLYKCAYASASVSTYSYSKNSYQPYPSNINTSEAVFQPRDAGGGGSSYSVAASANSFGSSEGGYTSSGGYGAPVMTNPPVYKLQIHPDPPMQMGWGAENPPMQMGWGNGNDDDGDFDFPKELIGLLGLKGFKGLKGLKGVIALLKALLLLKKLITIPLLPIFLPFTLPLLLFKLVLPLLPLLIILLPFLPLFPLPGAKLMDDTGKLYLQNKMETVMSHLPENITHIIEKINNFSTDPGLGQLLSKYSENGETSRGQYKKHLKNKFGDTGSSKSKVVYEAENAANMKPSVKSAKLTKKTETQVSKGGSSDPEETSHLL